MIRNRSDVTIDPRYDLGQVQIRPASENYPKSIFVRFHDKSLRMYVWSKRQQSKKKGLVIEEWLTETRANLYKKLKELKADKLIKDCFTDDGDVFAVILNKESKILLYINKHYSKVHFYKNVTMKLQTFYLVK